MIKGVDDEHFKNRSNTGKSKIFIEKGFRKSQIDICADCGWVGLREDAKSEKLEERIDFIIYQINCPNDDCGKRIRIVLRNNHYAT